MFARLCLFAQPTNRRVKFCLRMHARAAIEPHANFVLAGGFELGDPRFFFVRHALPELAATLDEHYQRNDLTTGTDCFCAKASRRSTAECFPRPAHAMTKKPR